MSVTGSDEALSEWLFTFPMGSHFDEAMFWADLLVKGGHNDVGVLVERSLVGKGYLGNFRKAVRAEAFVWRPKPTSLRPLRMSPTPCGACMKQRSPRSSTAGSDSVSCTSTLPCRAQLGSAALRQHRV